MLKKKVRSFMAGERPYLKEKNHPLNLKKLRRICYVNGDIECVDNELGGSLLNCE
jgi:hypothetical protein